MKITKPQLDALYELSHRVPPAMPSGNSYRRYAKRKQGAKK
jgi:hypothetical protein